MPRSNPIARTLEQRRARGAGQPVDPNSNSNVNRIQRLLGGIGSSENVFKSFPGGMANFYDDSWGSLLGSLEGGSDASETLTKLLRDFQGKPGDLEDWMQQAAPFIQASQAQALKKGAGFQFVNDPKNWDMGAMSGLGTGLGAIGEGTERAVSAGNQQLAKSGLGRSSARAALTANTRQRGATAGADLYSRTFQQSKQNQMTGALNALDSQRTLAQLALGMQPTPRMMDPGGGGGGLAEILGIAGGVAGGFGGLAGGIASMFGGGGKK